ncbi:MAG: universal stress protein [Gammaproteobacteria bacterium]|uniref:universal stress protein n=1 Tax=Rhodoferax sp. TaxID=50421 RepID=UPI00180A01DE|nr:universal stress protein [Rhodoferax sp.]MBU3900320.1 universal stress protein [Gammaproteobacteria bacterium]MBA3058492.1 universal stress protein [Rhodoferax sp.]MBU3998040.1 universal stress protein [Gammaproteobacteria bacterium]MBU4018907.1 universal stress protein [Gammaproteobacteria bacterium]MBU4080897.1 universal stress protein [Gammaproteobacteria bacterium]
MNTKTNKFGDLKVLACVDQSPYADHVTDAAAWAASRMQAPLELLHVIDRESVAARGDDHSGAIGINSQETLLGKLVEDDAIEAKAAREQGRGFLNRLRDRAQTAGIPTPDMRQRHGSLVETLTEQQADVRLVVMGRRGESAQTTSRALGRHVEQVVRAMQRPILTVTDNFSPPKRVLIAFDGGSASRNAVEMVASSPLFKGIPCHLIMVGKDGVRDASKQLDAAQSILAAGGMGTNSFQVKGDPESAIARAIQEQHIDMLIMGAYTHSPIRNLFMGSRTTELLRSARVPTLLLR